MPGIDFNSKVICDNIHGSIGVSKLELKIINTRTFQRLKKIKQLGLASFVFPGAEHSRFAHSIGAMHLMSQMVDKLKAEKCSYFDRKFESTKQKLRLAALLHDIGHYPLAHLGEQVFMWVEEKNVKSVAEGDPDGDSDEGILQCAARKHKVEAASHEKLGELILTSKKSEIYRAIKKARLDPAEIARIFNGEHETHEFYTQLMSSTLDCDRMDYLVRDCRAAGTSYGEVDIQYILRNLTWDPKTERVCFHPKAINALEHFIMARYFSYNITYHKAVMGFELMAKALFYAMIQDPDLAVNPHGSIVSSFDDVREKIRDDDSFLANFNDEYFWFYLEHWKPKSPFLKKMRENLLGRTPLRVPINERVLARVNGNGNYDKPSWYTLLQDKLMDERALQATLADEGLSRDNIALVTNEVDFEKVSSLRGYSDDKDDDKILKLIKILRDGQAEDLIADVGSIVHVLSNHKLLVTRLFVQVDKESEEERKI